MLAAAVAAVAAAGVEVERVSRTVETAPWGPSSRRFANAVLVGRWQGSARALLGALKAIERAFGRRRGRRWGARVLDLDLLFVGDEVIRAHGLVVPHRGLSCRPFVLAPLLEVAPQWRHPVLILTVRQMAARLAKPRPRP